MLHSTADLDILTPEDHAAENILEVLVLDRAVARHVRAYTGLDSSGDAKRTFTNAGIFSEIKALMADSDPRGHGYRGLGHRIARMSLPQFPDSSLFFPVRSYWFLGLIMEKYAYPPTGRRAHGAL